MSEAKQSIQEHYAKAARESSAGCCAPTAAGTDGSFGAGLYDGVDTSGIPESAVIASIACGVPTAMVEFREGDTVLDLGSGGGLDALLSAKRVGPTGRVYGVDMTPEMIELAQANAAAAGARNVDFLLGDIGVVPLPDDSVDVAISNCVINLAPDKPAVLRELGRLVRSGGRVGISDVVAENHLTVAQREERGSALGCVAGALSVEEYERGLRDAGFTEVSVEFTHEVAEAMHGAIIRASR
ncbi:MAG TPA: methyltransferase domain-containing protein [Pseudolysinimonas sp.]|jgi:SAM-dependent methyltransferase